MGYKVSQDTIDELENYFDDVRTDYSGRFMYGAECVGIVTDDAWTLRGEIEEIRKGLDPDAEIDARIIEDLEALTNSKPTTDSMGMSTIYYWPYIAVEAEA